MAVMVLCFSAGEKARKVLGNSYVSRVGDQIWEGELLASNSWVLGDIAGIIDIDSQCSTVDWTLKLPGRSHT
jgi:hypothetical protein